MKEILIESNDKELNSSKNSIKYYDTILNSFFIFRFLNLLKLAKKRKISYEDVKKFNKGIKEDEIIFEKSNNKNLSLIQNTTILNLLIEKNKTKIYFIVFLSILRIILMVLNPFLFKQFSKTNINFLYLTIFILILDFLRTSLSLKIELNSHELSLAIDNQVKQIIIKNDLLNNNNNKKENISVNEKISSCNTLFNNPSIISIIITIS